MSIPPLQIMVEESIVDQIGINDDTLPSKVASVTQHFDYSSLATPFVGRNNRDGTVAINSALCNSLNHQCSDPTRISFQSDSVNTSRGSGVLGPVSIIFTGEMPVILKTIRKAIRYLRLAAYKSTKVVDSAINLAVELVVSKTGLLAQRVDSSISLGDSLTYALDVCAGVGGNISVCQVGLYISLREFQGPTPISQRHDFITSEQIGVMLDEKSLREHSYACGFVSLKRPQSRTKDEMPLVSKAATSHSFFIAGSFRHDHKIYGFNEPRSAASETVPSLIKYSDISFNDLLTPNKEKKAAILSFLEEYHPDFECALFFNDIIAILSKLSRLRDYGHTGLFIGNF